MSNKKTFSKLLAASVLCAFVVSGATSISNQKIYPLSAEDHVSTGDTVTGIYRINEAFVPSKDTKIIHDGKEYTPTNIICTFPSGKTTSGKYFYLTEYGVYTFTYEAKIETGFISAKQTLSVKKDQYYFDTKDSSLDYNTLDESFRASGFSEGLCLSMAEGDTFHVSKPFNIYEQEVTNLINFKCVQRGIPVVKYMNIRITDCYDPNIYIDIAWKRGSLEYESYVQTGFKGSGMVGLVTDGSGTINIDNVLYKKDPNGTTLPSSFKYISEDNKTINSATYYFDNSNPLKPRIFCSSDRTYTYSLVSEFNNTDISSSTFPGFTNGNVYLSLTVSSFNGVQKAPMQIASINGKSGKDLLSMDFYQDETPPIITIDAPSLTNAALASTKVVLPTAGVIDDTGLRGTYSCYVWYDYNSFEGRKNIVTSIDEDGNYYFVPNRLGIYTVEYKATDVYGNVSTSLLTINVSSFGKKAFDFEPEKIESGVEAGSQVLFNKYKLESINELSDMYVVVTKPNGESDFIENLNEAYLLDMSGKYDVTYYFEDLFYSDSYTYSFTANNASKYSFDNSSVPTPYYYIANGIYTLAAPNCFTYNEKGKTLGETKTYVRYDDGEYSLVTNPKEFTIEEAHVGQKIQIKVACSLDENVFVESEPREIIDIGYVPKSSVSMEKYFQGNFTKTAENDYCSYLAEDTKGELKFVNKLLLSSFSFQFAFPLNSSISSFNIVLTDYNNPEISHKIKFSGTNNLALDNNDPTTLISSWCKSGEAFTVATSSNLSKITVNDSSLEFTNDFTSDYILLSLEFDGCTAGDTQLNVYKLGNQKLNYITTDNVIPNITVNTPDSIASVGDKFKVYIPSYCDILSPSSNNKCYLNVTYNNEPVTSDEGILLKDIQDPTSEYTVTIKGFGTYNISYSYYDGFNKMVRKEHNVYIYDTTPPTLTLSKTTDTVKASDDIKPIEVTVKDDTSTSENITVYFTAFDSKGMFVSSCKKDSSLSIKKTGEYIVYVYAYDEAGNFAIASYKLIVQ